MRCMLPMDGLELVEEGKNSEQNFIIISASTNILSYKSRST